jgi:hypothetical protein
VAGRGRGRNQAAAVATRGITAPKSSVRQMKKNLRRKENPAKFVCVINPLPSYGQAATMQPVIASQPKGSAGSALYARSFSFRSAVCAASPIETSHHLILESPTKKAIFQTQPTNMNAKLYVKFESPYRIAVTQIASFVFGDGIRQSLYVMRCCRLLMLALVSIALGTQSILLCASGGITSHAQFRSASRILEDPDDKDTEKTAEDRNRSELGVGEKAKLTFDSQNLGDETKIKWTIEPIPAPAKISGGGKTARLEISNFLFADSRPFTVKAEAETGVIAKKEFTARRPNNLTSKSLKEPAEIYLKNQVAASTKLWLVPTPHSVNFGGGVFTQEFDEGKEEVRPKTGWLPDHKPRKVPAEIDPEIAGNYDWLKFSYPPPNTDTVEFNNGEYLGHWKCRWKWGILDAELKPSYYSSPFGDFGLYIQTVKIASDSKGTVTISKFNSSVTRVAKENINNEQEYDVSGEPENQNN